MDEIESIVARAKGDLEKAQATAEKARETLRAADEEIERLSTFIQMYQRYSGVDAESVKAVRPTRSRSGTKSAALVDASVKVLSQTTHPMPIGALADAVEATGLEIGGAKRNANLAGYLSRDDRIQYEQGVGWSLTSDRNSEANEALGGHESASENPDGKENPNGPTLARLAGSTSMTSAPDLDWPGR